MHQAGLIQRGAYQNRFRCFFIAFTIFNRPRDAQGAASGMRFARFMKATTNDYRVFGAGVGFPRRSVCSLKRRL
jgi:hypothetical protein